LKKIFAVFVALALLLIVSQSWSTEQKSIRFLDNPPKEPGVLKPIPTEYDGLIKTFNEYWDALTKRDYEKAYNLESAEFRSSTGLEAYKGSIGFGKDVQLVNVRALGVKKISEKEVMVTGSMILKVPPISLRQAHLKPLKDRWIKEGETWRHIRQTGKS
jgi:hypothetical protein